jgi:hypothetical protein
VNRRHANFFPQRYDRISLLVKQISIMTSLWIFLALCPLVLGSLLAFASHIDPLSGRWRGERPVGSFGSHGLSGRGKHPERPEDPRQRHAEAKSAGTQYASADTQA